MNNRSFLLEQFDEFYREVIRLATAAANVQGSAAGERGFMTMFEGQLAGETMLQPQQTAIALVDEATPSGIRQKLQTLLERQALEVRRGMGDYAEVLYKEAQYVMTALADEIFLYLDWPGSQDWRLNILESQLFRSHRAGELVFEKIDKLLQERNPLYIDLAKINLITLGLGFQGKYRGIEDGEYQLAGYRRRLFEFVTNEEPELRDESRHLVPEAYASTLDEGAGAKLPYMGLWAVAFGVVVLLWLITGHAFWKYLIAPVEGILP
jgi:type VI secretion system protein ImpK